MTSAWARIRARERVVGLGEAELGDRDLRRQILTALGEVIAFDSFAWLLTDPVTAVGAAPLAEVPRHGVGDVASAVFADQYGCWGFLDLWRHRRHGPFDTADADLLATLSAPLARALRRCQARTFIEPAPAHRRDTGPVVLTLDDGLRITSLLAKIHPPPRAEAGRSS